MKVAVINGPNLNLLGTREPELYGSATIQDVEQLLSRLASDLNAALIFFQSNAEGELVDEIQRRADCDAIILNPGGYGHTSIALADAISGVGVPTVEVHVTNIHAREDFRHHTYSSAVCEAQISGLGIYGYQAALNYFVASRSAE